jgi:hypothetical protein
VVWSRSVPVYRVFGFIVDIIEWLQKKNIPPISRILGLQKKHPNPYAREHSASIPLPGTLLSLRSFLPQPSLPPHLICLRLILPSRVRGIGGVLAWLGHLDAGGEEAAPGAEPAAPRFGLICCGREGYLV